LERLPKFRASRSLDAIQNGPGVRFRIEHVRAMLATLLADSHIYRRQSKGRSLNDPAAGIAEQEFGLPQ
jgi:hypothetical protein